jgi:hypothetical protein
MILNLLRGFFGGNSAPSPQPTPPKAPPATDPNKYREWLTAEVLKKGQPPQGYESVGKVGDKDRKTFCNFFVRAVAKQIFNWTGFETVATDQAGEMTDYMESHPNLWKKLDGTFTYKTKNGNETKVGPDYEAAAGYAAQGCFVVAGWKNLDYPKTSPTGHVCVVAPENQLIFSNKWGRPVAIVANVGGGNWYGKGLSFAFSTTEPALYLFLGA